MFRKLLLACLLFTLGVFLAAAAHATPRHSITVQPIGLLFGIGNVEYEGMISNNNAWAARLDFFSLGLGDWNTSGIGVGASYRFFPIKKIRAPRGLWFGPAVDIMNVSSKYLGQTNGSAFVSILGEIGYKWLFGNEVAFVVSPFADLGYTVGSLRIGDSTLPWGGFTFGLGCSIGIAF
jgi:hypothetical protein